MTDDQRKRKNERDRARRAKLREQANERKSINGGINPATKLPHTATFLRAA